MADKVAVEQFQDILKKFIILRDSFRSAKKNNDYKSIISIGHSIIELDEFAKFLQISTPLFKKDMANAFIKLGDVESAREYLKATK
ncbi:hypothetical protein JKG47_17975 [Acidithiobacillus sp. MC6.1]|nr:hypothetical protein [Acidithiobacillus sp. MC6.1]